jgi:hypothetical protein
LLLKGGPKPADLLLSSIKPFAETFELLHCPCKMLKSLYQNPLYEKAFRSYHQVALFVNVKRADLLSSSHSYLELDFG